MSEVAISTSLPPVDTSSPPLLGRPASEKLFQLLAVGATALALLLLVVLLAAILSDGLFRIDWEFLTSFPSRRAERAGILSALVGSGLLMVLVAVISFPLGVGAAIYLEEYAPKNRFTHLLELNLANLAGVPSVIYGLLGLQIFVRALSLERSLISGALTLSLLILPVIIISSREALRTVPRSIREGALALGATRWQTVWLQVLPLAMPGVLTGCILAFSRAIGETAPLVTLGALTYIAFLPDQTYTMLTAWPEGSGVLDLARAFITDLKTPFTALPIQSFNWVSRPQPAFHENAAGAVTVLLIVLLAMNALAIWLRIHFQRRYK